MSNEERATMLAITYAIGFGLLACFVGYLGYGNWVLSGRDNTGAGFMIFFAAIGVGFVIFSLFATVYFLWKAWAPKINSAVDFGKRLFVGVWGISMTAAVALLLYFHFLVK